MERIVKIDGQELRMVANGATPRLYRSFFKADLFRKMRQAVASNGEVSDDGEVSGEIQDTEVFENLAFVMAMQGGSVSTGVKIDDWLTGFGPTSILEAIPDILDLWNGTNETTSDAKKE